MIKLIIIGEKLVDQAYHNLSKRKVVFCLSLKRTEYLAKKGPIHNIHSQESQERTLSLMLASIRKSKIPTVIFLFSCDGLHFHLHSSLVPSFSNVQDSCNQRPFLQQNHYHIHNIASLESISN